MDIKIKTSLIGIIWLSHHDDFIPILNAANIKFETLNLYYTPMTFDLFLTAPCVSELKEFKYHPSWDQIPFSPQQFLQLPFLSNLQHFPFPLSDMDPNDLITILSSPMMSNNLIELDFSHCDDPVKDVIKTICTTGTNPDDETSPLKYGKLRKLVFPQVDTASDIQLIVDNLTQLTHLDLGTPWDEVEPFMDKIITALTATERSEPNHPYISLPDLTHLDIGSCAITN